MNNYLNYSDSKEVKNVISIYKRLYSFMFNVWIYILLSLFALIVVLFFDYTTEEKFSHSASWYNWSIVRQWDFLFWNLVWYSDINLNNYKTFLLDGFVYNSWSQIYVDKSIVEYNWFVIPYQTYFKSYPNVKQISYFSWDYNIDELKTYVNSFIYNQDHLKFDNYPKPLSKSSKTQIPDWRTLKDFFNLDCVDTVKIYDGFCLKNVSIFFNNIVNYDLSDKWTELISLYNTFNNVSKWKEFCDSLTNYFYSTYNTDNVFSIIFTNCWESYISKFNTASQLKSINNWLLTQNGFWNTRFNKLINEYKLVSLQKLLYLNFTVNWKLNKTLLNEYLLDVSTSIDKQSLSNFYYDEIYYFNNTYLLPQLSANQNKAEEDDVKEFISKIHQINKWSPYWWKKLSDYFINSKLIELSNQSQSVSNLSSNNKILWWQDLFLWYLKRFENQYVLIWHTINLDSWIYDTKWVLSFTLNEKVVKLTSELSFKSDWNWWFLLKSVTFKEWKKLSDYINKLIEKNDWLIMNDLLTHIRAFSNIADENQKLTFCDSISNVLSEKIKSKEFNVTIKNCNDSSLLIEKWYLSNDNKYRYVFAFKWESMISYKVLNKELSDYLQDKIQVQNVLKSTFPSFLVNMISVELPSVSTTNESEIRTIQDRFKDYLWVNVTNIKSNVAGVYEVTFTLKQFEMIWLFNVKNNYTIESLDLIYWPKNSTPTRINVNGFTHSMVSDKRPDSNDFKLNTQEYLEKFDNKSVKDYLAAIANKN